MLRMDRVEPTEALHLLQCRAGVVVPAAIVPERPSALVRNPDHLGHELGKGMELRILRSLPQGSSLIAECLTDAKVQARRNGFSTMYLQCPVLRHDPALPPRTAHPNLLAVLPRSSLARTSSVIRRHLSPRKANASDNMGA